MRRRSMYALLSLVVLILFAGACRKNAPVAAPPATAPQPPPAPARPTVTLQASQTFIQRGDGVTLNWTSTNATELSLAPGIGRVSPEGSSRVTPSDSMTYTITAAGPGGSADASVRITVAAPPLPAPTPAARATIDELFRTNVRDAYFDYDKSDVRPDARDALARTAEFLRSHQIGRAHV